MKRILSLLLLVFLTFSCNAQNNILHEVSKQEKVAEIKPKLVVGIVVDQMRYDYLTRFADKYGDGGFVRLINDGFNFKNNHYNYIPTYTGPGHASIYTGTTPKNHGVISNNWYDKVEKKSVYCAGDDSVMPVGTENKAGKMSPHRMKTTSFADENRLFTQMRGKTIGISIKDRGAILPAGHTANAAYWFYGKNEGNFISSTFYMNELPQWVNGFNAKKYPEKHLKTWDTYYDISTYIESGEDLNNYEAGFNGKDTATFPYDLASLKDQNMGYDILRVTPFGNTIVTDFAIAAVKGESLGKDNITDVLAVSYSSTDYIGHNFGVNSKEVQDTYIRLDLEIERFLNFLDAEVGKGEYVVFLTSDHGAVEVPSYLKSVKIPAGYLDNDRAKQDLLFFLNTTYGSADIVENVSNNQIFLNHEKIAELNLELEDVQEAIVNEIIKYDHINNAYTATTMNSVSFKNGVEALIQKGYNQKRSGDVLYIMEPGVISYSKSDALKKSYDPKKGTTHGTGYNYDTHVPLIFYGAGINQGSTVKKTNIVDIAPTMSALLGISFPNGATGNVLYEVID